DEIIGICMRAVKGIEVNPDTLAEEVIRRVGPGGNFLTEEHTLRHFRGEFLFPPLGDRQLRRAWEEQGSKDAWARAREKARTILAEHRPTPVDARVVAAVQARHPRLFAEKRAAREEGLTCSSSGSF
ncbi:MAG: trimethylamine methyltransferase family protein, partial [Candidatus Desulforudis sp.]|nr:trimethylamine methyltransferase family protein [Desulforudis sp.]